jgi:hypothetical protein
MSVLMFVVSIMFLIVSPNAIFVRLGLFDFGFSFVGNLFSECGVFYSAGMLLSVSLNWISDVASLIVIA